MTRKTKQTISAILAALALVVLYGIVGGMDYTDSLFYECQRGNDAACTEFNNRSF